jgi:hypothetical protein
MIMATGSLLATEHRAADTAPAATEPEAEPITEQAAAEPAAGPAGVVPVPASAFTRLNGAAVHSEVTA